MWFRSCLLVLTLCAVCVRPASAQHGFRVTAGFGLQSSTYARTGGWLGGSESGDEGAFFVGASADVSRVRAGKDDFLPMSLFAESYLFSGILGGSDVRIVGFGGSVRKTFGDIALGVGIGIYTTKIPDAVYSLNGGLVSSGTSTKPGFKLFAQFPTRSTFFAELGYTAIGGSSVSPNATLALGLRF